MRPAAINKWITSLLAFLLIVFISLDADLVSATSKGATVGLTDRLAPLLGSRDSVAVERENGQMVVAINTERLLIPASILKVLTSLAAMHYLGDDYRFPTDFFLSPRHDLIIKGYGDPMLVSERLDEIANRISGKIKQINNLILDDTYFSNPIAIPGRNSSTQPYDAPNGALSVNFNTVFFNKVSGQWASAEPQTPLVPFALKKIKASGLKSGRITLTADRREILRYSGELFEFFLKQAGVKIEGEAAVGIVNSQTDQLVWRYEAPSQLTEVVADLLEFSNNFIANQMMLAMGASLYGPPATVEKGLRALNHYYTAVLGIKTGHIEEASGISRGNRISAEVMLQILEQFQPYHRLMRQKGRQWYKTGHLKGVRTRAGFLDGAKGDGPYRFVVMINTPGRGTDRIMRILESALE